MYNISVIYIGTHSCARSVRATSVHGDSNKASIQSLWLVILKGKSEGGGYPTRSGHLIATNRMVELSNGSTAMQLPSVPTNEAEERPDGTTEKPAHTLACTTHFCQVKGHFGNKEILRGSRSHYFYISRPRSNINLLIQNPQLCGCGMASTRRAGLNRNCCITVCTETLHSGNIRNVHKFL